VFFPKKGRTAATRYDRCYVRFADLSMIIRALQEVIDLGVGVFGLFVVALLALLGEIGFRIGRRRGHGVPLSDKETSSVSTLPTGMLGLAAFTLALTIGLAHDRFETRRHAATAPKVALGGGGIFIPTPDILGTLTILNSQESATIDPFENSHGTTFTTEWTVKHKLVDQPDGQVMGFL
jgi:hypothetical protein